MARPLPAALVTLALAGVAASACSPGGTSLSASRSTVPPTTTTLAPRGNVDGVLRIGALLPATGSGAGLGPSLLAGVQLAVAQINDAGGVNNHPVELVTADEAGDPAVAAVALERLLDQERVDALVGPASTRVTLSLLNTLTAAGVLTCSPTTTAISLSDFPDNGYYFRTAPPDSLEAVALARAISQTGGRSTAILYVDDDYGRTMADALASQLREQGNDVVARTAIDPTATEYAEQLRTVLDRDPAAIAYLGVRDPGVRVIQTLRSLGVDPASTPVFVSAGMRSPDPSAGSEPAEVIAGVQGTSMAPAYPAGVSFRDALATFDPKVANLYASYAYDCVNLIALAALSTRTDDPALMRSAMVDMSKTGAACRDFADCSARLRMGANIDLDGASGPIELAANGDASWGTFDLFQFDGLGQSPTISQLSVRT